jgi:hypothetical protein
MKILSFFIFFWVIFALLDPDPTDQINADPCGSGSGSETLREGEKKRWIKAAEKKRWIKEAEKKR